MEYQKGGAIGIVATLNRNIESVAVQERTDRVGCLGLPSEAPHSLSLELLPHQAPVRTVCADGCFQLAGLRPRCPVPNAFIVSTRVQAGKDKRYCVNGITAEVCHRVCT